MNFKDKTIVITGATSGLGLDIVQSLASCGANLAICGRNTEKMNQLVQKLPSPKKHLFYDSFDITNVKKAEEFIDNTLTKFNNIDFLINCAGANNARDKVANIRPDELNKMLQLNFFAPLNMMQLVYNKSMQKNQQGMIINILSTVCLFSNASIGSYTASKSALDAISKVFRKEAREDNVKVCSIYPGGIDTPFREAERPEYLSTEPVVNAVLTMMQQTQNSTIDELVIRPMIERNFS